MASGESPSSLPFPSLTELADALPPNCPIEQVNPDILCDIEDPILFQAVLTRLKSMVDEYEWRAITNRLASLSPRSFIVALAAGEFYLFDLNEKRLHWMLRGPRLYILNRPTMMLEVRELNLIRMQHFPTSLYHFASLRKLLFESDSLLLPDNAFSLVRQRVTGLQDLYVNTRRLSAPMLNDIVQMTNLESLEFIAHEYDAIPPLSNLQGLKTLGIWHLGQYQHNEPLIFPSTLEGLSRLETLEILTSIVDDLANMMPAMFPLLRKLRVYRWGLSDNVLASLRSHYENKAGFELVLERG